MSLSIGQPDITHYRSVTPYTNTIKLPNQFYILDSDDALAKQAH